uniref:Uncharacterized protein n=1 Tax=Caenorhabditis japonica TaxID=281687 RepID=A0A8R1DV19_CAEJA
MSDDEDEGRLQIDESPPVDYAEKPSISGDLNPNVNVNSNSNPNPNLENPEQEIENQEIPTQNLSKEDGELEEEEDEPMDTDDAEKVAKIEKAEEGAKENVNKKVDPSESMMKKSEMRPPQNTEKTPSSHRKRKESTENPRKSGLDTIDMAGPSTPQRSKRASSHQASAAITACFHDEDIVGMPPLPIQSTPTSSSSSATLSAKRHKLSNAMVPPSPGKEGSAMANTNGHAQVNI